MKIEIGTEVVDESESVFGEVADLDGGYVAVEFKARSFKIVDGETVVCGSKEKIYRYPNAFTDGVLKIRSNKFNRSACFFEERFTILTDKPAVVECGGFGLKNFKKIGEWRKVEKNEHLTVFAFEYRVLEDMTAVCVAFTPTENFCKLREGEGNFKLVCRMGKVASFKRAREILVNFLGYEGCGVEEADGNEDKVYL